MVRLAACSIPARSMIPCCTPVSFFSEARFLRVTPPSGLSSAFRTADCRLASLKMTDASSAASSEGISWVRGSRSVVSSAVGLSSTISSPPQDESDRLAAANRKPRAAILRVIFFITKTLRALPPRSSPRAGTPSVFALVRTQCRSTAEETMNRHCVHGNHLESFPMQKRCFSLLRKICPRLIAGEA